MFSKYYSNHIFLRMKNVYNYILMMQTFYKIKCNFIINNKSK